MNCTICDQRRPRRFCPGVRGEICSICCGTEREVTVNCPLDCEHLLDARQHEKYPLQDPDHVPNRDIRVTESFLMENERLVGAAGAVLYDAAVATHGSTDADVREALDALIRTRRTLESGLIYETRPANPVAANIQQRVQDGLERYRRELTERMGMATLRDSSILGVLAFYQRLAFDRNNGRPRGRAFISFLHEEFGRMRPGASQPEPGGSPLIL